MKIIGKVKPENSPHNDSTLRYIQVGEFPSVLPEGGISLF